MKAARAVAGRSAAITVVAKAAAMVVAKAVARAKAAAAVTRTPVVAAVGGAIAAVVAVMAVRKRGPLRLQTIQKSVQLRSPWRVTRRLAKALRVPMVDAAGVAVAAVAGVATAVAVKVRPSRRQMNLVPTMLRKAMLRKATSSLCRRKPQSRNTLRGRTVRRAKIAVDVVAAAAVTTVVAVAADVTQAGAALVAATAAGGARPGAAAATKVP